MSQEAGTYSDNRTYAHDLEKKSSAKMNSRKNPPLKNINPILRKENLINYTDTLLKKHTFKKTVAALSH